VSWGGIDVRLRGPGEDLVAAPDTLPVDAVEPDAPALPTGPILLAGTRSGGTGEFTVVGIVAGDSLEAFPSDQEAPGFRERFARNRLAPGTELVVFSEGARIGRMTVVEVGTDVGVCSPRPMVRGVVELVPGAGGRPTMLALVHPSATERPFGTSRALDHTYDQRVATLNLAAGAIRQAGAPMPASVLQARTDVRAFQVPEAEAPAVAATFVVGDRPEVAPAVDERAYALFLVASPGPEGYRSDYVWFRSADRDGKGVPRYVDHLDWDGDGDSEMLLEVLGADSRWFAGVADRAGAWTRTFEDPCGASGG
jgi:hypothetical protein